DIHIPAGLDLHLDPLVSVGEFLLNLLEQLRDGILHTDGHAAGNLAPGTAADVLPEGPAKPACFEVPDRGFQSAARHFMATNVVGEWGDIFGAGDFPSDNPRLDVV